MSSQDTKPYLTGFPSMDSMDNTNGCTRKTEKEVFSFDNDKRKEHSQLIDKQINAEEASCYLPVNSPYITPAPCVMY